MPANIFSYVGRVAAWHKLGTVTDHHMTWEEVATSNNNALRFQVFKSQLRDGLGRPVNAWGTFRWNWADWQSNAKDAAVFLGAVGEDYKVIQHSEGFRMVDALVNSVDGAHYETAGILGNGEKVWGLADLQLSVTVGAEKQAGYLLFCTSHDGSLSFQWRLCLTQVVCENPLGAALSERTRAKLTIRHTKNASDRITAATEALAGLRGDIQTVEQKLNFLAQRRPNREALAAILDRLFPRPKKDDGTQAESSSRRDNVLADILQLYESNRNNTFPEHAGTSYALLNAITEYADHGRATRGNGDNGRAESALFGSGDKLKADALSLILRESESMRQVAKPIVVDWADMGLNVPAAHAS
jgi:phage/plasmid-like protein (TIGR03299 family)